MELPDPIEVRTCVNLQVLQSNLVGSASVRHCTRIGLRYVIGVELSSVELSSKIFLTVRDPRRPGGDDSAKCQSAGNDSTIDQHPDDELRLFFQDAKARRKARESARWKSRLKFWSRVTLAVWAAVVVLFLFNVPKFIRIAYEIYPHPILRSVAAGAGAKANHGQEDVKEQELAGTKPPQ
jgi:hypothetical protein